MLRKAKKDEGREKLNLSVVALLHGGYWLVYLVLFLSIISTFARMQQGASEFHLSPFLPLVVLAVIPNLISFYSFYFWLFPAFLSQRRILALAVVGALVCVCSALAGAFLSSIFFGFSQAIFADASEFARLLTSLFVLAAIHGTIALVIRGFIAWFGDIKLKEELARRNFEAEMALVRSQINPHFLFNTINNIDVLIAKDAEKASRCLNKLSDILRYAVYETKSEKISLATELGYIERYLDLQRIRTNNPDYIRFQVVGNANGIAVAPMIFFPFIENAFKHTENSKNASSIRVSVSVEDRSVLFECENSYLPNGKSEREFGGLGNELVRKRLALIYGERHELRIADDGKTYKVKLTLE